MSAEECHVHLPVDRSPSSLPDEKLRAWDTIRHLDRIANSAAAPHRRSEREEHVAAGSAARSDVSIEPIGRLLTAPPEPAKSPLSHIVLDPQAYRA
jgi:hypothetical protein